MCFKKIKAHLHVFLCLGEGVVSFSKECSAPSKESRIQKGHKLLISWHLVSVSLSQERVHAERSKLASLQGAAGTW